MAELNETIHQTVRLRIMANIVAGDQKCIAIVCEWLPQDYFWRRCL